MIWRWIIICLLYTSKAFGAAIKAARTGRKESRKKVSDEMFISPRYLANIENSIKAAQSKGYEQWAKLHNLKQAAKTMNFLTEHKIEQYADLVSRIEEMLSLIHI